MYKSVQQAFSKLRTDHKESAKWKGVFAFFMVPCFIAMGVVSHVEKSIDLLSGKRAVEKFLSANFAGFAVIFVTFIAFIILVFKTFKGKKSSMTQLIVTVGIGIVILWLGINMGKSVHNYTEDLNNVSKAEISEYVLCTLARNGETVYYLGFEDRGEYLLLAIPQRDYDRLSQGAVSDTHTENEVYSLVTGSEYVNYENAEIYLSPISVEYYFNSAVFGSYTAKE